MPLLQPTTSASSRNALKSSASLLTLTAAGALGWSGLAQAAGEATPSQMLLLPEHYELMENGVVVFKLETGENLSLTADQYLILDDGLLLITDELAQASVYSLPVMGSVRAQLLSDLAPVATIDGTVAEATPAQTLSITEGQAPRLSEQVDLQSYEVVQSSGDTTNGAGDALATSMSVAPGAMALLGMLMTSDRPQSALVEPPEFLSNAAFQALTPADARAFTGSAGDSFIGYTAATAATTAQDALIDAGKGIATSATFNMSAGGNNFLLAADFAAASGSFDYTGGSGDDSLIFGMYLAFNTDGDATFDMSEGGNNTITAGIDAAYSGSLAYTGGSGVDSLTFGMNLAQNTDGDATFDMSEGGNNTFVADTNVAYNGSLSYTGGSGVDSLTFGMNLAFNTDGDATFDMSEGGNNTFVAGTNAAYSGSLAYTGGSGVDSLTFGDNLAYALPGSVTLDLGNDTAADAVKFQGSIAESGGTVTIKNFNFNHDTIDVQAGVSATAGEIADAGGDLTWTDSGGSHTIVFEEIGTGGAGVLATATQLIADII